MPSPDRLGSRLTEVASIRVVPDKERDVGLEWEPVIGPEARRVLSELPLAERGRAGSSAVGILGRCLAPIGPPAARTGLVVGYIQSGKTLSFTTVAGLARDNGFAIVILIAGISDLLLEQSRERLRSDLNLARDDAYRTWVRFDSPTKADHRRRLEAVLEDWRDPRVGPEERATVFVTVMKNTAQLSKLTELLGTVDVGAVSALIIDDEADQASLNTRFRKGEESATNRAIRRLREVLPRHTFLQYTATPQAPLLLTLTDWLSPDFCVVLEPGSEYVGGKDFFTGDQRHVRLIDEEDRPDDETAGAEPPAGLLMAMKIFYLGAAASALSPEPLPCVSMLVHPSRKVDPQGVYQRWVTRVLELWEELLSRPANDPDRVDLETEFSAAHQDLSSTANLPPLQALLEKLPRIMRKTTVQVVNATRGRFTAIDWSLAPAWILVGGQLLDRGFTVKGLTVTYLSRPIGVGNADTLQQRARFYGYKRMYLGYCRVYVDVQTREALEHYVRHEEHMRNSLMTLGGGEKPLSTWRRKFLLDSSLKPTRNSVMSLPVQHDVYSDRWFRQSRPHIATAAVAANRSAIDQYLAKLSLKPDPGHSDRRPSQKHLLASTSLRDLSEALLTRLTIADPEDSVDFSGVLLQLATYLEGADHGAEQADVYRMRPAGIEDGIEVSRRRLEDDKIQQLFQGEQPKAPQIYPGDDEVHGDFVTVQIHRLDLTRDGKVVAADVPVLAVWVPERLGVAWLIQRTP